MWPGKAACQWRLIGGWLVDEDGVVLLIRDVQCVLVGLSFDVGGWPIFARGNAAVS